MTILPERLSAQTSRFHRLFWPVITGSFAIFFALFATGFSVAVFYFGFHRGEEAQTAASAFFAGISGTIGRWLALRAVTRTQSRLSSSLPE